MVNRKLRVREKDWKPGIIFKVMTLVTYFFQIGPTY
jgi:hypothetical protein